MQPHGVEEWTIHPWPLQASSRGSLEVWSIYWFLRCAYFWFAGNYFRAELCHYSKAWRLMLAWEKLSSTWQKREWNLKEAVGSSRRGSCWVRKEAFRNLSILDRHLTLRKVINKFSVRKMNTHIWKNTSIIYVLHVHLASQLFQQKLHL